MQRLRDARLASPIILAFMASHSINARMISRSLRPALAGGAEIDLVLTLPGAARWAIEIKRGMAPKFGRGFHEACADIMPAKRFVGYAGRERFALNAETQAISLPELAAELRSFARQKSLA